MFLQDHLFNLCIFQLKTLHTGTSGLCKLSNVRYGAMKKLELPCQKNYKQLTLHDFKKNSSSVKNKKSSNFAVQQIQKNCTKSLAPKVDEQFMGPKIAVLNANTFCSGSFDEVYFAKLHNKENFSNASEIASPTYADTNSRHFANDFSLCQTGENLAKINDTCNKHNTSNGLINADQNCGENFDNQEVHEDSICFPYCDMTMKFSADSQGNPIFDRFTQKNNLDCNSEDSKLIIPDSELDLYKSFENGLMHNSNCQSTQKFSL